MSDVATPLRARSIAAAALVILALHLFAAVALGASPMGSLASNTLQAMASLAAALASLGA